MGSEPMQFRKKPVVIEAMEWTGENEAQLRAFVGNREWLWFNAPEDDGTPTKVYDTLHTSWIDFTVGDFIIKGIKGEFYPCVPDVFALTHDPAPPPAAPDRDRLTPEREATAHAITSKLRNGFLSRSTIIESDPRFDGCWIVVPDEDFYEARQALESLRAEIDALRAERDRYEKAIRWALGEEGDFPPYPGPRVMQNGMKLHQYWYWRSELRARAALPGGTEK